MNARSPFEDKLSLSVDRLVVDHLGGARGERVLFEDLSFGAGPGELIEIRGANGAGKTTLLRMLAGLIKPRAGRIAFTPVETPELALHLIGHRDGLKATLDVAAHARYWAGLLGGNAREISRALERVGLAALVRLPARALSQGQGRRLSLARLLVAPRPVWLLDEPAAGLDAEGRVLLGELIEAHRESGGLVIAAVHDGLGPAPSQTLTLGAA